MKERVIMLLDDLKIKYRCLEHPAAFTVEDLNNLDESIKPIKNLLLQEDDGKRKFLVVMAGNERLDLKAIRVKLCSKRLRFASDRTLFQTFGITPGAVSIFGFLHEGAKDVEVIIDKEILKDEELGFHPNYNTATIFFPSDQLESILQSMGCSYTFMELY